MGLLREKKWCGPDSTTWPTPHRSLHCTQREVDPSRTAATWESADHPEALWMPRHAYRCTQWTIPCATACYSTQSREGSRHMLFGSAAVRLLEAAVALPPQGRSEEEEACGILLFLWEVPSHLCPTLSLPTTPKPTSKRHSRSCRPQQRRGRR